MRKYTVTPSFGAFEDKPEVGMDAQITFETDDIEQGLEACFEKMQNGPKVMKGYKHRSLSVGDILTVCCHCENGTKELHDWIVKPFGFRRLSASEAHKWGWMTPIDRAHKLARVCDGQSLSSTAGH